MVVVSTFTVTCRVAAVVSCHCLVFCCSHHRGYLESTLSTLHLIFCPPFSGIIQILCFLLSLLVSECAHRIGIYKQGLIGVINADLLFEVLTNLRSLTALCSPYDQTLPQLSLHALELTHFTHSYALTTVSFSSTLDFLPSKYS